jgi:hypothetical protein
MVVVSSALEEGEETENTDFKNIDVDGMEKLICKLFKIFVLFFLLLVVHLPRLYQMWTHYFLKYQYVINCRLPQVQHLF